MQEGSALQKINKCIQPWLSKWGNYREIEQVLFYKSIREYLGYGNEEGDILVDTCVYENSHHSTNKTIEVSDNESNINLQSTINTPTSSSNYNKQYIAISLAKRNKYSIPPSQTNHNGYNNYQKSYSFPGTR